MRSRLAVGSKANRAELQCKSRVFVIPRDLQCYSRRSSVSASALLVAVRNVSTEAAVYKSVQRMRNEEHSAVWQPVNAFDFDMRSAY